MSTQLKLFCYEPRPSTQPPRGRRPRAATARRAVALPEPSAMGLGAWWRFHEGVCQEAHAAALGGLPREPPASLAEESRDMWLKAFDFISGRKAAR